VDGIADLGGMQGFGAVRVEPDEPVFHEEWERRAFALGALAPRISGTNVDAFRHALDRLDPVRYFGEGYYGRWASAVELLLVDRGVLAPGAVEARARRLRGEAVEEPPDPPPPAPAPPPGSPGPFREVERPPRFAPGDRVWALRLGPRGHTRLARYVRGRIGTVALVHPAAVLPDTNAHLRGEHPQHVYAVRFSSEELWGPSAEAFDLTIDLYETYLEPAA
jgi:nitrile hydratase beta subunit